MVNFAIRGHATRGEEIIEILGMLGGSNAFGHIGNNTRAIYYINEKYKNFITCYETENVDDCIIFTVEEFIEKFPYKVGDKVKYRNNIFHIKSLQWDSEKNTVIYYIDADWSAGYVVEIDDLQPYKE